MTDPDPSDVCQFCESIVTDVHKFISAKKTEAEIAHFLSTACAIIPNKQTADKCKTIVEEYVPELIDMIVSEVKPAAVCGLMHLCTGFKYTAKHPNAMLSPPLITVPLAKFESGVVVKEQKICTDCKVFFGDIIDELTDPAMVKQLEDMIDAELCGLLPDTYKKECTDMVSEMLPIVLSYAKSYMNATEMCEALMFCPMTSERSQILFNVIKETALYDSLRKLVDAESCVICKMIMAEVLAMDRNANVQKEIENFVKTEICAHLGTFKDSCTGLVDEYAALAFQFLATVLDPDTRCRGFGFCPAIDGPSSDDNALHFVRKATPKEVQSSISTSTECILCEYVMGEIEKILENNKTEDEIIAALDKVCNIMPSTVRKSCLDFVNTYGPAIITILETELTPGEVCTVLGLCKSTRAVKTVTKKGDDAETCLICETLVQYVEALLKENSTVTDVENIVKKICNFLPDTMKTECDTIIDEYGSLIVQYILAKYDPKEVCTMIKLCDGAGVESVRMVNLVPAKHRLLSAKCTYGPSYWCASQENADQCGAVEHCKKYVWKN